MSVATIPTKTPTRLGTLGEPLCEAYAWLHAPATVAWEIDFLRREQRRGDHSEATAAQLADWLAIREKQRELLASEVA